MTIAVKDRRLILFAPPSWVLPGADIDFWFSQGLEFGGDISNNFSISRAQTAPSYASTIDGLQVAFATANTPRITNKGWLIEDPRTNVVLWNRDLTNAAWTATNVTVAKNQVGADGVANSASSLTATGANGTVLQTTTVASSARLQSAFVKRITGTGTINMTMDNGVTWTAITVTNSYTQLTIPTQTLANPVVGFRIVTSGDAIAVDFVQNENSAANASSPIPTTTVAVLRNADNVTFTGNYSNLFNSSQGSSIMMTTGAQPSTTSVMLGFSDAKNNYTIAANNLRNDWGGAILTTGNTATWTGSVKSGLSWDAVGKSIVLNNGTVANDLFPPSASTLTLLGRTNANTFYFNGYFTRLVGYNTRLPDATLQALTL